MRLLRERLVEERLLTAVAAVSTAEQAIARTLDYTRDRKAFGKAILDFQNSRFKLAEAVTDTDVARAFVDECIMKFIRGELGDAEAAMAKYWSTEPRTASSTTAFSSTGAMAICSNIRSRASGSIAASRASMPGPTRS